jgi:hypothetical protein
LRNSNISSFQPSRSQLVGLIINFFKILKAYEKKLILKNGLLPLFFSRIISIGGIILSVYFLSFLSLFIGSYFVGSYFKDIQGSQTDYWWSIPLLFGLPLLIKLFSNFNDRDYIFCEQVINFLETLEYSGIKIGSFRFAFEIFIFIVFLVIYSILLILGLTIFLDYTFLDKLLDSKSINGIFITISATIYLSIRILGMEEKTKFNKYIKAKRTLYLWSSATLFTIIFVIKDLVELNEAFSFEFPYACITLLLAIEKTRDSYKVLKQCLKDFLSND